MVLAIHYFQCYYQANKDLTSYKKSKSQKNIYLSNYHLIMFLFFLFLTILNPHRIVSKTDKFETLQCHLRIEKRGKRQYIGVSLVHLYICIKNEVLKMVPSLLPSSNQYSFPYQLTHVSAWRKRLDNLRAVCPYHSGLPQHSRTPDKNETRWLMAFLGVCSKS